MRTSSSSGFRDYMQGKLGTYRACTASSVHCSMFGWGLSTKAQTLELSWSSGAGALALQG